MASRWHPTLDSPALGLILAIASPTANKKKGERDKQTTKSGGVGGEPRRTESSMSGCNTAGLKRV